VSTLASVYDVPEPAESPAANFTRAGRIAAAATLVLGAGFQMLAFFFSADIDDTEEQLAWVAANPDRANLAKTFDYLAMPFLLGAALVYVLLARRRSPRLAYAGGVLLGTGLVGLTAVQGVETLEYSLAQDGRFQLSTLADAVDDVSIAPAIAIFITFLPGAFFGLLTMTVALWRSRAVPRGAVLLIPVFMLTDFALAMGDLSHTIAFVGACWIAFALLARTPQRGRSSA
jgi:hypothetical protein